MKELGLSIRYRKILCGLTSPIRKLPTELLVVILDHVLFGNDWNFLQCVDSKSKYTSTISSGASSFFRRLPVMSIISTCMQWRALATSTPRWWSRIAVNIASKQSPRAVKHSVNLKLLLQLFLRRSKEYPLTINLIIKGYDSDFPAPVIKLLLMHCHRWWSFQYEGDLPIGDHIRGNFDFRVLRQVKMVLKDYIVLEPFSRAANLTTLVTTALFDLNPSVPSILLFDRIKELDIEICSRIATSDFLTDMADFFPNITILSLRELGDNIRPESFAFSEASTSGGPALNHLHTLRICLNKKNTTQHLLKCILAQLSLPALTELQIMARPNESYSHIWPEELFRSFLDRSSPQIAKFILQRVGISTLQLISVLRSLPSIIHLHINDELLASDHSPITPRRSSMPCTGIRTASRHPFTFFPN